MKVVVEVSDGVAGAQEHALYEYTAAVEYLQKSREEHGYSDFAASQDYAERAREHAENPPPDDWRGITIMKTK